VQVDRLVGWQKSVGHISICNGRSQPGRSHEDADACSRWRQGEPVCHAFYGTLQIREKQTTQSACALRVRTRPKASRFDAVCALYGAHARRAWSCGFFKAARRLGPFVWCLWDDLRDVRGGIDRDEGSSSPRGAEGQPYAGKPTHESSCFEANGVDVESIEAGEAKHRAIVSEGPGSANCAGSRAPPTVTVMHAPTGQRDGRIPGIGVRSSTESVMVSTKFEPMLIC
jgi:hypothetical protein